MKIEKTISGDEEHKVVDGIIKTITAIEKKPFFIVLYMPIESIGHEKIMFYENKINVLNRIAIITALGRIINTIGDRVLNRKVKD
jgi:hypothetical protein